MLWKAINFFAGLTLFLLIETTPLGASTLSSTISEYPTTSQFTSSSSSFSSISSPQEYKFYFDLKDGQHVVAGIGGGSIVKRGIVLALNGPQSSQRIPAVIKIANDPSGKTNFALRTEKDILKSLQGIGEYLSYLFLTFHVKKRN